MLDTSLKELKSSNPCFRFMDLVAELRCKIYGFLLEEKDPIKITAYRRRPVREGFGYETKEKQQDFVWSERLAKWINQPPSTLAILSVSRQVNKETVPIAYSNTFSFTHPQHFKAFVRGIGSMCDHIKYIELSKQTFWSTDKRTNPFLLLLELTNLRTLKIKQSAFATTDYPPRRSEHEGLLKFVEDIKEPLEMFDFLQ